MKRKNAFIMSLAAALSLSAGLLAGCGGGGSETTAAAAPDLVSDTPDGLTSDYGDEEQGIESLTGAWDNDEIQNSLIFLDDGTVEHYQPVLGNYFKGCFYEWDGENVVLHFIKKGEIVSGIMDEDGDLVFEGIDGWYTRVDEAGYAFEPEYSEFADETEGDELELAGTAWELGGNTYLFYEDGTAAVIDLAYDSYTGEYVWDGASGSVSIDGSTVEISYYRGNFFVQDDMSYWAFTYLGPADPDLLSD